MKCMAVAKHIGNVVDDVLAWQRMMERERERPQKKHSDDKA